MSRLLSRGVLWIVLTAAAVALAEGGDAGKVIEGWGRAEDPLGDCKIRLEGEALVIEVPEKLHDLSAERGVVNAPMVLDAVERDFIAGVRVAKLGRVDGESTSGYSLPYQGTGLLLWKDRDNYIRLEWANLLRERQILNYINFEHRVNGNHAGAQNVHAPEGPMVLRLEKRGDRVIGSYSFPDGARWFSLKPLTVQGDAGWKVGVTAINSASVPFRAELDDFVIFDARPPARQRP